MNEDKIVIVPTASPIARLRHMPKGAMRLNAYRRLLGRYADDPIANDILASLAHAIDTPGTYVMSPAHYALALADPAGSNN